MTTTSNNTPPDSSPFFEENKNGHSLYLGMTGSGKTLHAHTVILNSIDQNKQVIVLDLFGDTKSIEQAVPKERVLRTEIGRESTINIVQPTWETFGQQFDYVCSCLQIMLSFQNDHDVVFSHAQTTSLKRALLAVYGGKWRNRNKHPVKLSSLVDQLLVLKTPTSLKLAKQIELLFCRNSANAAIFDQEDVDTITLNKQLHVYDFGEIDRSCATPFMQLWYFSFLSAIYHAIRENPDQERLIVIEGAELLAENRFLKSIDLMFRVLKQYNTTILLLAQSPQTMLVNSENEWTSNDIGSTIRRNVSNVLVKRMSGNDMEYLQEVYPHIEYSHIRFLQNNPVREGNYLRITKTTCEKLHHKLTEKQKKILIV